MSTREWQCGECGAWVATGWTHHVHLGETKPSIGLEQMRAIRAAEEAGIVHGQDALACTTATTTYYRTFKEPTREATSG